jgi:HEAT repeat protein
MLGRPDISKLKARADTTRLIAALGYRKSKDHRKNEEIRDGAVAALAELGTPSIPALVAALAAPDQYSASPAPSNAARALTQIGVPAIDPLIGALTDRRACGAATSALAQIGAPAVAPLVAALRNGGAEVRTGAGDALRLIGAPAVEPLVAALGDKSEQVRAAAAGTLGRIGDPRVLGPLTRALPDQADIVRSAIARALDELAWEPGISADGAAYWAARRAWDKCVETGASSVEPLISALKNKSSRPDIARALGEIGDPRAVAPLIALLDAAEEEVQAAATAALAGIGDAAVDPLIVVLDDKDWRVRCCAAEALGRIGDVRAADPLADAMHDWHEVVKRAAALALGRVGDARAASSLIAVLDYDEDPDRPP